jgi:hypothetical protein
VIINGKEYDGKTGLLIKKTTIESTPIINKKINIPTPIKAMAQKSIKHGVGLAQKVGRTMDVVCKKKFAHQTSLDKLPKQSVKTANLSSTPQTIKGVSKTKLKLPLSKTIKNKSTPTMQKKIEKKESVKEKPNESIQTKVDKKPMNKKLKIAALVFTSFFIITITGFLIYSFMPSFSVKIASAQAGIDATYPEYYPNDYSLSGPVTYVDDNILINFHSNIDDSKFTIKQSKSSWDSSAVKNLAEIEAGSDVVTTSEKGLTIFDFRLKELN